MIFNRKKGVLWLLALLIICTGCGDIIRPVITPIPPPGGDPQLVNHATVIARNSDGVSPGSATQVDVSGDTVTSIVPAGINPVHATLGTNGGITYIANSGSDNINIIATQNPSSFNGAAITLPAGSKPVFVLPGTALSVYVAESGTGMLGVISTASNVRTEGVKVGTNPVALVRNSAGDKIYAINNGSNNVTVVATKDNAVLSTISVGGAPLWGVLGPDGSRIYVVNSGGNTVSVIDTASDTVVATLAVGTGPNFAYSDSKLRRIYVTNPGSNSVSIINADPNSANFLKVVSVPVGTAPVSVIALADGTRAYVANSGSNNVSVINTLNNTVTKIISVGNSPVSIASSPESTKVFVANKGSGDISIIRTADDSALVPRAAGSNQPVFVLITP